MMPRMARTLVNLSLCGTGATLLDPFCGTGGILIEAEMLGIHTLGSDFDPLMIREVPGMSAKVPSFLPIPPAFRYGNEWWMQL